MFDPGGSSDNSDGAGWVADSGLGVDNSTNGGFCMLAEIMEALLLEMVAAGLMKQVELMLLLIVGMLWDVLLI